MTNNVWDKVKDGFIVLTSTPEDGEAVQEIKGNLKIYIDSVRTTEQGNMSVLEYTKKTVEEVATQKIIDRFPNDKAQFNPTIYLALNSYDDDFAEFLLTELQQKHMNVYYGSVRGSSSTIVKAVQKDKENVILALKRALYNPNDTHQQMINYFMSKKPQPLSTGLKPLDKLLDGGIRAGLYALGAPTSAGKSTLALQIADNLAENYQQPVMYFALEMSKKQLVCKSLNRMAFELDGGALFADEVQHGHQVPNVETISNEPWYDEPDKVVKEGKMSHQDIARLHQVFDQQSYFSYLIDIESDQVGRITAEDIQKKVIAYMKRTSAKPVVIVDYLQIMGSKNDRETDKQKVTDAITGLKNISLKFDLPIIVISSFNRSSYHSDNVDLDAFKESGDIEYTADVILTMTYDFNETMYASDLNKELWENGSPKYSIAQWISGDREPTNDKKIKINDKDFQIAFDLARMQPNRMMKIKISKNRFGRIRPNAILQYLPARDWFSDPDIDINAEATKANKRKGINAQGEIQNETDFKRKREEEQIDLALANRGILK